MKKISDIEKCSMSVDGIGNCATCMFRRTWLNSRKLHEGDEACCDNSEVEVRKETA